MTKKPFIIILILSFFTTHAADLIDAVISNTLLGGKSGFPFKDGSTTMFGGGTTDNYMFFLNLLFWFIVIFIIWKFTQKILKKKS